MGLAISKRYVEMLGGKISVKSKPKGGSKFKVQLPKIVVEVLEEFTGAAIEKAESKNNNRAVLLVSKNINTKRLIQDYLSNYNIMLAHLHTVEGLDKINPLNYDALFVDMDEDSFNIWNSLKSIKEKNSVIPMIVMKMIEEERVGYGLAVDEYIFGKVNEDVLKNLLESYHKNNKIKNVCIVHDTESEQSNHLPVMEGVVYHNFSNWERFNAIFAANIFDAVIFEMLEPEYNTIELIYKFRTIRTAKSIYVAFALPAEMKNTQARTLYDEMNEITLKAKYHPMDVLKVVRDKLNLSVELEVLETEPPAAAEQHSAAVPVPLKKILIVDDDNDTLFTIGEIIAGIGYEAVFANNGIECLSVLAKGIPDLILLDIMMPQMDGFETIKKIRGEELFKDIPVAALTAYEMLDNKEVIEKNGFNDLITKPIDSKTLAFKIEKLLMVKQ